MFHRLFISLFLFTLLQGCASTGESVADKRQAVNQMRSDVLAQLYQYKPSARQEIAHSPGYAVFSNVGVNILLASFGGGYGIAHDNGSGKDTYMKMGEVGLGIGLGLKDFRAVFVFNNRQAYTNFVNYGWSFGGEADAAAKASDMGGAINAEGAINGVTVYQFTQSGLALQATLKGTKFWVDHSLTP